MNDKRKVILLDVSMIFVPCVKVYSTLKKLQIETGKPEFVMEPVKMYFNSLLTTLKKIGVNEDDVIVVAGEGKSFRKDYYSPYKAQRQGLRDKDTYVDWSEQFKALNKLHDQLKESTDWKFVRVAQGLEADDVIAIGCRYFKDREVIVVTGDKDLYQLDYYLNVSMYTLNQKTHGSKGAYIEVKNPLKIIADKARLGDLADNILVDKMNDTEEDLNLRYFIVNLLELPPVIEQRGIEAFDRAMEEDKELDLELLPDFKDVEEKFLKIYKKDKVITKEYCLKLFEKRKLKKEKEKKEKKKNGTKKTK